MTENKGDLISREALKKAIIEHRDDYVEDNFFWSKLFNIIDNAPTVEEVSVIEFKEPLPPVKAQKIIRALNKRPQGEITEEDIQNAIKAGYENGYSMAQAKYQRPQDDLADEVWKLYEKYHSHLATHVIEFGDELKDLLGKEE